MSNQNNNSSIPNRDPRRLAAPVLINNIGRQPFFGQRGGGLNSSNTPSARSAAHVRNPLQRKIG